MAQIAAPLTGRYSAGEAGLATQIAMITRRNLTVIFRTPQALLPPLIISVFFLVIYNSTLGEAAAFLPGLSGNSYLGFILPLSLVSSALSGSSLAAQNLVRDIESGYFDKLLLTPASRTALLLGPIVAGGFILGLQAVFVIAVGLLMGLQSATGIAGLLAVIGLAILLGSGFAGFSLAQNVESADAVDRLLQEAVAAGATLVRPADKVFWGGYRGYFADPDGFLWEVCWNPFFPLDDQGNVCLPESGSAVAGSLETP